MMRRTATARATPPAAKTRRTPRTATCRTSTAPSTPTAPAAPSPSSARARRRRARRPRPPRSAPSSSRPGSASSSRPTRTTTRRPCASATRPRPRRSAPKDRAERPTINEALRDAALEADVDPRKIKRLLRLVDREGITVDEDGEVDGADEAVADLLEEFPEFKAPAGKPNDDGDGTAAGASPRRRQAGPRRKPKELTKEQVAKLAREDPDRFNEDPDRFNELFEAGKIPASALGG
jgi:hypothetical protein